MGGGVGRVDQRLASRRGRPVRLRHAGGRHRLLPGCRGVVVSASPAAPRRRLSRAHGPARRRGRRRWRLASPRRFAPSAAFARSGARRWRATAGGGHAGELCRARAAVGADGRGCRRSRPVFRSPVAKRFWRPSSRCRAGRGSRLRSASARGDAGEVADEPGDRSAGRWRSVATIDFDEALRMEFRIVSRVCRGHDFYEGVRAAHRRQGQSAALARCRRRQAEVDSYFAPLGDDELTLPVRPHEISDAPDPRRRRGARRSFARQAAGRQAVLGDLAAMRLEHGAALVHAHARLGLGRQGPVQLGDHSGTFPVSDISRRMALPLQATIVAFACFDLLAAVGLWLAAPWGGAIWLLCAVVEAASPVLSPRAAAIGAGGALLNIALVVGYFFLSWRARARETRRLTNARSECRWSQSFASAAADRRAGAVHLRPSNVNKGFQFSLKFTRAGKPSIHPDS